MGRKLTVGERMARGETRVKSLEERVKDERIKVAQAMTLHMAAGEPYSIEQFMYAATAGQPEKYDEVTQTLCTLNSLKPKEMVGIVGSTRCRDDRRNGKLVLAGVVAEEPLTFKIYTPTADTGRFVAMINFGEALQGSLQGDRFFGRSVTGGDIPEAHEVFHMYQVAPEEFEYSHVVIGSLAIMRAVEGDELGERIFAELIDVMAKK